MFLPMQNKIAKRVLCTNTFKGLCAKDYVPDGMLADLKNISFGSYPVASSRGVRGITTAQQGITALNGDTHLYYVVNNTLVTEQGTFPLPLEADTKRQIVIMGAYVFVFPDKVYINTAQQSPTLEYLENFFSNANATKLAVFKIPYDFDWTKNKHVGVIGADPDKSAPQASGYPQIGDIIIGTYSTPTTLYQCVAIDENYTITKWTEINNYYLAIFAYDENENNIPIQGFCEGDVAEISPVAGTSIGGAYYIENNITRKVTVNGEEQLHKGIVINCKTDSDSLGVKSDFPLTTYFDGSGFSVKRTVPDMDMVMGCNGRLWGCSSKNHEIYSSALGNPQVWQDYSNSANASFALTVAGDGDFTGCAFYKSYIMFFKEQCVYKIYGTKPANYTLTQQELYGVEKGAEASVKIVDDMLYFKSTNGIYSYNGAGAVRVSENLGDTKYIGGIAGAENYLYYLCTTTQNGDRALLVYDTVRGIWTKQDCPKITHIASKNGTMYMYGDGRLITTQVTKGSTPEESVDWFLETGNIYADTTGNKYFSKIQVRLYLGNMSGANVYIRGNTDADWQKVYSLETASSRVITVPIIPKRCDSIRIKIQGTGTFKLFTIAKTAEGSSEL